jgi:rRNA maturation endonuclease Nob1
MKKMKRKMKNKKWEKEMLGSTLMNKEIDDSICPNCGSPLKARYISHSDIDTNRKSVTNTWCPVCKGSFFKR